MTVAELIALLQAMPQDAEVEVHDADTNWLLPLTGHHYYGSAVRFAKDSELDPDGKQPLVVIQSSGY